MKNRDKLIQVLHAGQIVGDFADSNSKIGKQSKTTAICKADCVLLEID